MLDCNWNWGISGLSVQAESDLGPQLEATDAS